MTESIGDLGPYLIKVLNPNGGVNGTGFLCHPDGYALTCYHVTTPWLKQQRKEIQVIHCGQTYSATLLPERSTEAGDIAVFQLKTREKACPWPYLSLDIYWRVDLDHKLRSFGYPQGGVLAEPGISITGTIGGLTPTTIKGVKVYPITGFNLRNVNGGYSGAPMVNQETFKVIGLVDAMHYDTQAFITPLDMLFTAWPEIKAFHDVSRCILERFGKDVREKLERHLRDTSFIPLGLEQGILPKCKDKEQEENTTSQGRQWQSLEIKQLLSPIGKQIFSADAGTGKTTLLLWLTAEIVKVNKNALIPIFFSCTEFERYLANPWDELKKKLISRYRTEFLETDLRYCLDKAYNDGRIVFLLDGLDQIQGSNYSELATIAFDFAADNAVLIASRPSSALALESNPDIAFLRLQPFSSADQRRYFGESYAEARKLSAIEPDLAQIPMLAFMIRSLVKDGAAKSVTTRTELYKHFVTYILVKHQPSLPLYTEQPDLAFDINTALCMLAYRAMAEAQPQIQRVETKFYKSLNQPVKIQDLTKFGLVNLVLERGEKQLLFFTHQSFQEFLAAQYLVEHKQELDQVLAERWHPKWAEVIKFLAGLNGDALIDWLLQQPDNVIHADLFLAARCFFEASNVRSELKNRIQDRLMTLPESLFRTDEEAIKDIGVFNNPQALLRYIFTSYGSNWEVPYKVQAFAAGTLVHYGKQFLVDIREPLLKLLITENKVGEDWFGMDQKWAVKIVGGLGEQIPLDMIYEIAKGLQHNNRSVRWVTMRALAELVEWMPPSLIVEITEHLLDKNFAVLYEAPDILAKWGMWFPNEVVLEIKGRLGKLDWMEIDRVYGILPKILERISPEVFQIIAEGLGDEDFAVHNRTVRLLGLFRTRLPETVVETIAHMLSDPDEVVRWSAVDTLGQQGQWLSPELIHQIASLLSDVDATVRKYALAALGKSCEQITPDVILEIAGSLYDESAYVCELAIKVLLKLGDKLPPAVICEIADILNSKQHFDKVDWKESKISRTVVNGLAKLKKHLSSEIFWKIANRLQDDKYVCNVAFESLEKMSEWLTPEMFQEIAIMFLNETCKVGNHRFMPLVAIQELAARLLDKESHRRLSAINDLAALEECWRPLPPELIEPLVELLRDENGDVRQHARYALKDIWYCFPSNIVQNLIEMLNNENYSVRDGASDTLVILIKQQPLEVIPEMLKRSRDENERICHGIILVFSEAREYPLPHNALLRIVEWLKDNTVWVRSYALQILSMQALRYPDQLPPVAIPEIIRTLREDKSCVDELKLDHWEWMGLLRWLTETKFAAILAPELIPVLVKHLKLPGIHSSDDYHVQAMAVESLGMLTDYLPDEIINRLRNMLGHVSGHVRDAAIKALGKVGGRLPSEAMHEIAYYGWPGTTAAQTLANLAPQLSPDLIQYMASGLRDSDKRELVIKLLGQQGDHLKPEAIQAIATYWLNDKTSGARIAGNEILKILYHKGILLPLSITTSIQSTCSQALN